MAIGTGYADLMWIWMLLACTETPAPPASPPPPAAPPPTGTAKHALLVVVDTLRADALARANTPNIDALAARGDQVERAWSAGTWTVPSVVSLLTGMPVRQHGWDLPTGRIGSYPPLPEAPTIATVLREQGFETAGFYANPYLAEQLGFDRGFDLWQRSVDKAIPDRFAKHVEETWGDGQRHFAYVHFIGPHSPLKPSEEARARWEVAPEWLDEKRGLGIGAAKRDQEPGVREAYAAAYHAVIEDTDVRVGAVVAALGAHRDDTVIVLVSDHGEMLGEHDKVGHGTMLYEPLTRVPFIADRGTLPDTLGIASAPAVLSAHLGVAHAWPTAADAALPLVAQREGRLALSPDGVHKGTWEDETLTVYNLSTDPGELTPVAAPPPAVSEARAAWEARVPPGSVAMESVSLHPETIEALKAMGYLE